MELDPLLLSRLQFAFVVIFHVIFPIFSIGLATYLALLNGLFFKTGNPAWRRLADFWVKVFAVVFGMGVVSGIVMSFQFGTNWSNFSQASANFLGPMLSYEVITAFFLEAGFLGVLLFGRDKVPPGAHLFASLMVALGTLISTFWILAANSWMHTPQGTELIDGTFHVTSWWAAIFTPSFPYRLGHMVLASFITGGFVVAGVSAWYLLIGRDQLANRKALSMSLWLLLVMTPAQAVLGDFHGLNTLEHQPTKVAAMEGNWEAQRGAPLVLFALPDRDIQGNHFELAIPKLSSLILTHSFDGEIPGLKDVPKDEQPPVWITFWAFRVMVALSLLMIAVSFYGLWSRRGGRLYQHRGYLQLLRLMTIVPFVAAVSGWVVTETGRAPWLVYGVMTHAEGLTPSLTGGMALFTLIGYMAVYAVVFSSGVFYLTRVVRGGMMDNEQQPPEQSRRPTRPLSASDIPFDTDNAPQGG